MENNQTPYEQYKAAKIKAGRSYVSEEEYYKSIPPTIWKDAAGNPICKREDYQQLLKDYINSNPHPKLIETFDSGPPKFLPLDECKVTIKYKGTVYKSGDLTVGQIEALAKKYNGQEPPKKWFVVETK